MTENRQRVVWFYKHKNGTISRGGCGDWLPISYDLSEPLEQLRVSEPHLVHVVQFERDENGDLNDNHRR